MAKSKLKLSELKVQSFVTALEDEQLDNVKGGFLVKGQRYTFRSRWTSIDTRVNEAEVAGSTVKNG